MSSGRYGCHASDAELRAVRAGGESSPAIAPGSRRGGARCAEVDLLFGVVHAGSRSACRDAYAGNHAAGRSCGWNSDAARSGRRGGDTRRPESKTFRFHSTPARTYRHRSAFHAGRHPGRFWCLDYAAARGLSCEVVARNRGIGDNGFRCSGGVVLSRFSARAGVPPAFRLRSSAKGTRPVLVDRDRASVLRPESRPRRGESESRVYRGLSLAAANSPGRRGALRLSAADAKHHPVHRRSCTPQLLSCASDGERRGGNDGSLSRVLNDALRRQDLLNEIDRGQS